VTRLWLRQTGVLIHANPLCELTPLVRSKVSQFWGFFDVMESKNAWRKLLILNEQQFVILFCHVLQCGPMSIWMQQRLRR
jgi:hypothetical protein